MKKLLSLIIISLTLTGCIAVPVYDSGYYSYYYGPRMYRYGGPEVSIFVPLFHGGHGGHGFRGGHGPRGGGR